MHEQARVSARVASALAEASADIEFSWIGDFSDAERKVRVRVQPATGAGFF